MQSRAGGWPRGVSAGHSKRQKGGQHAVSETLQWGDTRSLLYSSGTKLLQHPVRQCDFHLQEGDFHFLGFLEPA